MIETREEENRIVLYDDGKEIGEMTWSVANDQLIIVDHTGVDKAYGGRGLAKQLLKAMVERVRRLNQEVIPLCSFVKTQFERNPEAYEDIWHREER